MFSDHNGIKLEIIIERRLEPTPPPNVWRLNNTLLNNTEVKEKVSKEIKICFE